MFNGNIARFSRRHVYSGTRHLLLVLVVHVPFVNDLATYIHTHVVVLAVFSAHRALARGQRILGRNVRVASDADPRCPRTEYTVQGGRSLATERGRRRAGLSKEQVSRAPATLVHDRTCGGHVCGTRLQETPAAQGAHEQRWRHRARGAEERGSRVGRHRGGT